MAFNGTEGTMISRTNARQLLENYENSPAFPANNNTKGVLFGRDHLLAIIGQSGCKGIRVYFGKDGVRAEDPVQLVIVGTDEEGNDMSSGLVLDAGLPCPDVCPTEATKL